MGILIPWSILMALQVYEYGIKKGQLPEPYHFIIGSAVMGAAGVIGMANPKVGTMFAWALLLGAFVAQYTADHNAATQKVADSSSPTNPLPVPGG